MSCRSDGKPAETAAFVAARESYGGSSAFPLHANSPLTPDGRYVYFTAGDPLVPKDVNGKYDVYRYEVATGKLTLMSPGTQGEDAFFLEATPDGRDVFIATRSQLSPWDHDEARDIYTARVGGGVEPPATKPRDCDTANSCRGGDGPGPGDEGIGSASYEGAGNIPRSSTCEREDEEHRRARREAQRRKAAAQLAERRFRRAKRATGRISPKEARSLRRKLKQERRRLRAAKQQQAVSAAALRGCRSAGSRDGSSS